MFQELIDNYYRNRLNKTEMKIKEVKGRIKYEESHFGFIDELAKDGFYSYSGFSASAYHAEKGEVEINVSKLKRHLNKLEIKQTSLMNKLNLTNKNAS